MTISIAGYCPIEYVDNDGGVLALSGQRIDGLVAKYGAPIYLYQASAMRQRVAELRACLPSEVLLSYAVKANPMPEVIECMASLVDGLDIASGGEMTTALELGVAGERMSFAGPAKSEQELSQAVGAGVLVNVESFREIAVLKRLSRTMSGRARVAVRVNPDFELKAAGMRMGGGPKQFGIDADQVPEALRAIGEAELAFEGFHIYWGSQSLSAGAIADAQSKSVDLAIALAKSAPGPVRMLNIGGGFGIPYFPGDARLSLSEISANLVKLESRVRHELPGAALKIELGRYLVGEAGVYVCRVVDRKISKGQVFLITDGGLHHHLAATGNFGQVIRRNYPVAIANRLNDPATETASIVGPLCTPLDLLADRVLLPRAEEGDLIAVFQSGAYGYSASPKDFLGHPYPRQALV